MKRIEPLPDETALAFVERAEALNVHDDDVDRVLEEHFGVYEDGDKKELKLRSRVFWEEFYLERTRELFDRGGARYAAFRFIQRKNHHAEERRKLTDEQIAALVDSVGKWQR